MYFIICSNHTSLNLYRSIEARATGVGEMAQAHERTADQRTSQKKI